MLDVNEGFLPPTSQWLDGPSQRSSQGKRAERHHEDCGYPRSIDVENGLVEDYPTRWGSVKV